jgi:hypothetical protein
MSLRERLLALLQEEPEDATDEVIIDDESTGEDEIFEDVEGSEESEEPEGGDDGGNQEEPDGGEQEGDGEQDLPAEERLEEPAEETEGDSVLTHVEYLIEEIAELKKDIARLKLANFAPAEPIGDDTDIFEDVN